MRARFASVLLTLVLASPGLAQVVVPNSYENTAGGGSFLGPLSSAFRIYQLIIDDSQLTDLVGEQLASITWRLLPSATVNWPTADVNISNYDILLSNSVDPVNRSLTFANNVVGAQTLVRTGPLLIPAGSFKAESSPQPFGLELVFDTPYLYTGGNLLIELRKSTFTGTSASTDALLTSNPDYGNLVSAAWSGTSGATSGSQGNAVVTRINTIVPEPATLSAAMGGLALLIRRRR
jgi:hypothetical protein